MIMKKMIPFFIFLVAIAACSTTKEVPVKKEQNTVPNTDIRKIELDQIKVGDKLTKITAVLGKPTEKKITPQGTEMVWWLTGAGYEDAYKTLSQKPAETKDHKFIKLIFNEKDILVTKDFLL